MATFSRSIEGAQLLINLLYGFPLRIVALNDVLLNLAGAIVNFAADGIVIVSVLAMGRRKGSLSCR